MLFQFWHAHSNLSHLWCGTLTCKTNQRLFPGCNIVIVLTFFCAKVVNCEWETSQTQIEVAIKGQLWIERRRIYRLSWTVDYIGIKSDFLPLLALLCKTQSKSVIHDSEGCPKGSVATMKRWAGITTMSIMSTLFVKRWWNGCNRSPARVDTWESSGSNQDVHITRRKDDAKMSAARRVLSGVSLAAWEGRCWCWIVSWMVLLY